VHFLDVSGEELSKSVTAGDPHSAMRRSLSQFTASGGAGVRPASANVSLPRLLALLELSIRSSTAVTDPFKVRELSQTTRYRPLQQAGALWCSPWQCVCVCAEDLGRKFPSPFCARLRGRSAGHSMHGTLVLGHKGLLHSLSRTANPIPSQAPPPALNTSQPLA
jgi:hypothetical protein